MPNGKSSSKIMVGSARLGIDMSEADGSDGAPLWVGWVAGLASAFGCGDGGLTTLTIGTRAAYLFIFLGIMCLSIIG